LAVLPRDPVSFPGKCVAQKMVHRLQWKAGLVPSDSNQLQYFATLLNCNAPF
jgi:hypothetical protein